jgi:antitoxin PrlF
MTAATITSKGQITIPSSVRMALQVVAGDRIEFVKVADGRYEVVAATRDIQALKGLVKVDKAVSVEEMHAAIQARVGQS